MSRTTFVKKRIVICCVHHLVLAAASVTSSETMRGTSGRHLQDLSISPRLVRARLPGAAAKSVASDQF